MKKSRRYWSCREAFFHLSLEKCRVLEMTARSFNAAKSEPARKGEF
jgi:hypothetical protein